MYVESRQGHGLISVSLEFYKRDALAFWTNVFLGLYLLAVLGFAVLALARRAFELKRAYFYYYGLCCIS